MIRMLYKYKKEGISDNRQLLIDNKWRKTQREMSSKLVDHYDFDLCDYKINKVVFTQNTVEFRDAVEKLKFWDTLTK